MKAEILETQTPFHVVPQQRDDGTLAAPQRLTIVTRPCWSKPPKTYELTYAYEAGNVIYYHAVEILKK